LVKEETVIWKGVFLPILLWSDYVGSPLKKEGEGIGKFSVSYEYPAIFLREMFMVHPP
jgi:hypothetical protein